MIGNLVWDSLSVPLVWGVLLIPEGPCLSPGLNLPEIFTWDDSWGVHLGALILAPHLGSVAQVPQDLAHILDHSHAVLPTVVPEAGGRELGGQDTGHSLEGGEERVSGHASKPL